MDNELFYLFFFRKTCDRRSIKLDKTVIALVVNFNNKKRGPEKIITPMQNVRDAKPQWSQPIDMLCGKLFGLVGIEMFIFGVCARHECEWAQAIQKQRHHHQKIAGNFIHI